MYVELKHINKNFGNFKASNNVNISIEKGSLSALLGPSGSGKTTILRMIAGLEQPDSGDIFIDGEKVNDMPASKRGIGFVFQNYALFRFMSIYDNIAFGLEVQKKDKKIIKERVMELINLIGLKGLEKRYPHQLSGGQRQRVAFARALAPNPHLLLLDEPFAAIDSKVRQELRIWLKETIKKVGITSIFVTHDQDEAIEVADNIIVTNRGEVEQTGTPLEIYRNPSTLFVSRFIGQSTQFEDYSKLKGFSSKNNLGIAVIRPEFIKISSKDELQQYPKSVENGEVKSVFFRGSHLEISVQVKDVILTGIRSLEKSTLQVGDKVDVLIYRIFAYGKDGMHIIENELLEYNEAVYI